MITAIIGLAWRISSKLTEVSTKLDGLDHAQSLNTKLEMMDASEAAAIPDDITAMRDSLSQLPTTEAVGLRLATAVTSMTI